MCDCVASTHLSLPTIKIRNSSYSTTNQTHYHPHIHTKKSCRTRSLKLAAAAAKSSRNSDGELGFKEKERERLELEPEETGTKATDSGDLGFLEVEEGKREGRGEEDLVAVKEDGAVKIEEGSRRANRRRRGKQLIKRSNLLAKQVISIRSALSLGFVSQIWVDTANWVVVAVEVRPNLLSGEAERFLLEDVSQVGDVVLVENENVLETELKMAGLDTLVGYSVVTPGRQNIGKVRGYSFNINSGAVESLELDSFGISIIPSSLVSTYALPVVDVLEVISDIVVVHEAAASHIQRLTKGFWDPQNAGTRIDEVEEYSDYEDPAKPARGRRSRKTSGSQKFNPRINETEDDWNVPMDFL
ncbi:hypothetical protein Tsubulata_000116 [Turnera subulata]|uniref:PRC-barrel domain-containing protein n=1 Tax=Turnera subulata TaxID=218843 RepID=A0A9Q0FJG1_9ROSI|nr:hypothetical protein Tsubulata_000116 [Turnera subulata]